MRFYNLRLSGVCPLPRVADPEVPLPWAVPIPREGAVLQPCGATLNRAPTGMSVPQRPCPHVCTETGVRPGVRRMFPSGSGK